MSNAKLAEASDGFEPELVRAAEGHERALHTRAPDAEATAARLWHPKRVLITPAAKALEQGRAMLQRAAGFGAEVVELRSNRMEPIRAESAGRAYAAAKGTLMITVSPPGARKLQPIPPSADWQFHLAQGCPAHCQYCYLAGSLSGPPVTRVYANVTEMLENLRRYLGTGKI